MLNLWDTSCKFSLVSFLFGGVCELKHLRRKHMASGKVKWFDNKKGFGFIAQDSGQDVFVHHTSIVGSGFKTLNEGEEVNFEVISSDKGPKAQNVQRGQA
jgi:CspA family cold shock protein